MLNNTEFINGRQSILQNTAVYAQYYSNNVYEVVRKIEQLKYITKDKMKNWNILKLNGDRNDQGPNHIIILIFRKRTTKLP